MSLYTHVTNKEALFDLMFTEVIERLLQIDDQPTWQQELEEGCHHARAVLLAHPQWVALLTRVAVPPMTMRLYDRMLTLMAADGISSEGTLLTVSAAMSFTVGLVLTERMLGSANLPVPERHLRTAEEHLRSLPQGTFPSLARSITTFRQWSFERVFSAGLESIIAGASRYRAGVPSDGCSKASAASVSAGRASSRK